MIPSARFVGGPAGVDGWVASFGALGGHVHQVDAIGEVAAAVDAAVAGRAPVLVGADPLVRSAGVRGDMQWPDCGIDGAATAAVGVVGVIAGIAATGSLVVDAAVARGRAVSLLPPVCVFVLDATTIVDTPSAFFRGHHERWPDRPPSQVVVITGPSRSADIEMTLTVGVHGPGEVHCVIVGG